MDWHADGFVLGFTVAPPSLHRTKDYLAAGMNVMRLNCSHGSHEFFAEATKTLKRDVLNARVRGVDFSDGALEDVCAVALDTKGPESECSLLSEPRPNRATLRNPPKHTLTHIVCSFQFAQGWLRVGLPRKLF